MPRRPLTTDEIAEARLVFGNGLDYSRARVFENTRWPNLIADVGAALHGSRRQSDNAVTLGNTCYFPVILRTSAEVIASGELTHVTWLLHELTHQWQFQRMGWGYLLRALRVQLREGQQGYAYKGKHPSPEAALRAALTAGRRLRDFNLEQQGDLARDYYLALKQRRDASTWEPFVAEFRMPAPAQ